MLPQNLGPLEVRVLGALIEKELSTPDHYPLSLNALTGACNQSSNRDPVMTLADAEVSGAIDTLRRQSLVRSFQGSGERVPKYQHLLAQSEELSQAELAVLSVLMLRGPQTMAEIRTRAGRLMPAEDADGVEAALEGLITREPTPGAARLLRRPGQKEVRYAHLLGGEVSYEGRDDISVPSVASSSDRIAALEEITRALREEMNVLRAALDDNTRQLDAFRKQFE